MDYNSIVYMYNIHCISMSHGLVISMTSMLLIDTGISQYGINTLVTCSHVIAIYRYQ